MMDAGSFSSRDYINLSNLNFDVISIPLPQKIGLFFFMKNGIL